MHICHSVSHSVSQSVTSSHFLYLSPFSLTSPHIPLPQNRPYGQFLRRFIFSCLTNFGTLELTFVVVLGIIIRVKRHVKKNSIKILISSLLNCHSVSALRLRDTTKTRIQIFGLTCCRHFLSLSLSVPPCDRISIFRKFCTHHEAQDAENSRERS